MSAAHCEVSTARPPPIYPAADFQGGVGSGSCGSSGGAVAHRGSARSGCTGLGLGPAWEPLCMREQMSGLHSPACQCMPHFPFCALPLLCIALPAPFLGECLSLQIPCTCTGLLARFLLQQLHSRARGIPHHSKRYAMRGEATEAGSGASVKGGYATSVQAVLQGGLCNKLQNKIGYRGVGCGDHSCVCCPGQSSADWAAVTRRAAAALMTCSRASTAAGMSPGQASRGLPGQASEGLPGQASRGLAMSRMAE